MPVIHGQHENTLTELRAQFVPDARAMPEVMVTFIPLAAYEELGTVRPGAAA